MLAFIFLLIFVILVVVYYLYSKPTIESFDEIKELTFDDIVEGFDNEQKPKCPHKCDNSCPSPCNRCDILHKLDEMRNMQLEHQQTTLHPPLPPPTVPTSALPSPPVVVAQEPLKCPPCQECKKCEPIVQRQFTDLSKYILKTNVPPCPSVNFDLYMKKSDCVIPDMSKYVLKSTIPSFQCPPCEQAPPRTSETQVSKEMCRKLFTEEEIIPRRPIHQQPVEEMPVDKKSNTLPTQRFEKEIQNKDVDSQTSTKSYEYDEPVQNEINRPPPILEKRFSQSNDISDNRSVTNIPVYPKEKVRNTISYYKKNVVRPYPNYINLNH